MPSQLPASFASATNGVTDPNSGVRNITRGETSGDWSRPRTNGTTQPFRRPSLATSISQQRDNGPPSATTPSSGVYVPPHLNSNYQSSYTRNSALGDSRYSKEQLLDFYRAQAEGPLSCSIADLFVGGWTPEASSATNSDTWNSRDSFKESNNGPEICWDYDGSIQPLGLIEMDEDEKELFQTSVNSPLKAPPQNATKDSTATNTVNGRKSSISQMQGSAQAPGASTSSIRPGNRRRETSDSLPPNTLLSSPASSLRKDDAQTSTPSPGLLRRRTDLKDSSFATSFSDRVRESSRQDDTFDPSSPLGSFKRGGPLSAGLNGPSSPWNTPQSAGLGPMGAFGSFSLGGNLGQPSTPGEKKPAFGSQRGESRFKGLMAEKSSEEMTSKLRDKASASSLEMLPETETERKSSIWDSARSTQSFGTEQRGERPQTGSAALGGDDASPPPQHGGINRKSSRDDAGFSTFANPSEMPSFREMMQRREYAQQQTPQMRNFSGHHSGEPMSPTDTNPYQSPEGEKVIPEDIDTDDSEAPQTHMPGGGMASYSSRPFNPGYEVAPSDRSQTSSAGPGRNLPNPSNLGGLSGLGAIGPWSMAPGAVGTPSRVIPGYGVAFGESPFGSFGDFQPPTQTGAGAFGVSNPIHNVGTFGRGSKMGSLFPAAMQDQMRNNEFSKVEHTSDDSRDLQRNMTKSTGNANAPGFGGSIQDVDTPTRHARGVLDDLFENRTRGVQGSSALFGGNEQFNQAQTSASQMPFSSASTLIGTPSVTASAASNFSGLGQDQDSSSGISNQIPATQQRQMVMPDRMRWIYRDPQGKTQGPWSGLEMHDWYKAGFFSPELQVKKLEDADYEPLAQLIRRIGNSREPFLVPQIGIPHGSAAPSSSGPALGTIPAASPHIQSGSAQPPFASSFPSFGTTLTAEQQNALERRKQEEQYLMARQKEHLAQQQVMIKQLHMQGPLAMQQLHHHSSAHSLHSQPSYGSISSPTVYQPGPSQQQFQPPGAIPGFFDAQMRASGPGIGVMGMVPDPLSQGRDPDMAAQLDRLNLGRGPQAPFPSHPQAMGPQEALNHQQQLQAMMQDRAHLQREQEQYDLMRRNIMDEPQAGMDRFMQFQQLREPETNRSQFSQGDAPDQSSVQESVEQDIVHESEPASSAGVRDSLDSPVPAEPKAAEPLSLTQQVQKAALAKDSPPVHTQSPWAKIEPGLPQPFPPPQSASPLPAPAAQRSGRNVADTLAAESRSRSQTPSVETPSATIAPWAREPTEGAKGPSLKEIQEAEARKTAQQEVLAAAAKRAALHEQERLLAQAQANTPAPGLPSTANWASGSPSTPTGSGPSAWAKPLAGKAPVATPMTGAKKTLAQIQKEEEIRKQKLAAAQAAAQVTSNLSGAPALGGKRYADLASKVASPPQGPGGAWTTVGAGGGKAKMPLGPTITTTATRTASGSSATGITAIGVKAKPLAAPVRNNTGPLPGQNANDEFQKWAKGALSKGLNSSINVDAFVRDLVQLPSEPEILSEAIYANSQTLDGRRFAEEFIRRRKLADRGIVSTDPVVSFSPVNGGLGSGEDGKGKGGNGGWSEVAKKGGSGVGGVNAGGSASGDGGVQAFKVVAAKKKGKR